MKTKKLLKKLSDKIDLAHRVVLLEDTVGELQRRLTELEARQPKWYVFTQPQCGGSDSTQPQPYEITITSANI